MTPRELAPLFQPLTIRSTRLSRVAPSWRFSGFPPLRSGCPASRPLGASRDSLRCAPVAQLFRDAGMQRGFMNDRAPPPKMVDYLCRCAAGGGGLIISESTSPDHSSAYWQPMMGRLEPATLQAWKNATAE